MWKQFCHLILVLLCFYSRFADSCTAIGVTPGASKSKTAIVVHTDDAGGTVSDVRIVAVERKYLSGAGIPKRAVYNFNAGYPRLVSPERGSQYQPVAEYNGKSRVQEYSEPLGYVPDISPLELVDELGSITQLSSGTDSFLKRPDSEKFRYAYFDQDYGMMNEVQLSIVESTAGAKTVGWPSNLPYGYNLFGIAELTKVALERCISARCAVTLMGDLAVEYGFFSEDSGDPNEAYYRGASEALILADRLGEVWVFHVLTGQHNASAIWAAKRVPDGEVTALANGFSIRDIDFEDSENYLFSPKMKQDAIELGLWSEEESTFDFSKVFGYYDPTYQTSLYVGRRIWRVFDLLAKSLKLDPTLGWISRTPTYPFSIKPDEPVEVETLMAILKDHYEGTPYDMTNTVAAGPFGNPNRYDVDTKLVGGWERPISIWRSMFSFIVEISTESGRNVFWFGPDKAQGTLYFPFYSDQVSVEEEFKTGIQSEFDFSSAWRAFNFANNFAMLRYDVISAEIATKRDKLQEDALKLVRNNASPEELSTFRISAVKEWWSFCWTLVAKYSDGYKVTGEGPNDFNGLGYPDNWLKTTEYVHFPGNTFTPPLEEKSHFRIQE